MKASAMQSMHQYEVRRAKVTQRRSDPLRHGFVLNVISTKVERSLDVSEIVRDSSTSLGMTIDIDASRQRQSLDFLRGLRIKNPVESLCIIQCWAFCG
jgi:hypothetical protein